MPVFDLKCEPCDAVEEVFLRRYDDESPCPGCGGRRVKLFSRFAAPFMGSIHKYVDPNREGSHMDGFWAYRKRSSISGQPEPVYLDSMQAVKEFNRAEGLAAPGEVPTNCTVSSDGKRIVSAGMPGQWQCGMPPIPARLQEILDTPMENFKPAPATAEPCMPIDYGIKSQVVE